MEKEKHHDVAGNEQLENSDFIYAPSLLNNYVPILFRISRGRAQLHHARPLPGMSGNE